MLDRDWRRRDAARATQHTSSAQPTLASQRLGHKEDDEELYDFGDIRLINLVIVRVIAPTRSRANTTVATNTTVSSEYLRDSQAPNAGDVISDAANVAETNPHAVVLSRGSVMSAT